MNNKVLRVIGICAGTALLGVGLGGCSSSQKAKDSFPAEQVASEVNAAQVYREQQQEQARSVQQTRLQLQTALGTDVYPQAVWEAIVGRKMLPVHLASMAGAVKIAQQELRNQPGYTDTDINKWLSEQVKQGVLRSSEFSDTTLDYLRLEKFTLDTRQGTVSQDLLARLAPKFSAAYQQAGKQAAGLKTNALVTQAVEMQTTIPSNTGIPVLEPDLGPGVKLQGFAKVEQALQTQMQQGVPPAK